MRSGSKYDKIGAFFAQLRRGNFCAMLARRQLRHRLFKQNAACCIRHKQLHIGSGFQVKPDGSFLRKRVGEHLHGKIAGMGRLTRGYRISDGAEALLEFYLIDVV